MAKKAMTLPQFERKLCSALKVDQLSKGQRTVASAAHGVYLRQLSQVNDEVADLRVEVERGRADLMLEQFKVALGGIVSREALQRFGSFWITPIARSSSAHLPENAPRGLLPEYSGEAALAGQDVGEHEVHIVEQGSGIDSKVPGESEIRADSESQRGIDAYLKSAPWYLRYPTVVLAKVFGEMTPLAAAVLLVSAVGGAIVSDSGRGRSGRGTTKRSLPTWSGSKLSFLESGMWWLT